MGPSGSGKTTFLNALTGRVKSTGTIRINGQHTVQEIQPLTGFVPQVSVMICDMSFALHGSNCSCVCLVVVVMFMYHTHCIG